MPCLSHSARSENCKWCMVPEAPGCSRSWPLQCRRTDSGRLAAGKQHCCSQDRGPARHTWGPPHLKRRHVVLPGAQRSLPFRAAALSPFQASSCTVNARHGVAVCEGVGPRPLGFPGARICACWPLSEAHTRHSRPEAPAEVVVGGWWHRLNKHQQAYLEGPRGPRRRSATLGPASRLLWPSLRPRLRAAPSSGATAGGTGPAAERTPGSACQPEPLQRRRCTLRSGALGRRV